MVIEAFGIFVVILLCLAVIIPTVPVCFILCKDPKQSSGERDEAEMSQEMTIATVDHNMMIRLEV